MTCPAGAALFTLVMEDDRPALETANVAAACVCPTTDGTRAPSETVNVTVAPLSTKVPAGGAELITLPIATVVLLALTVAATRPASLSSPSAIRPV